MVLVVVGFQVISKASPAGTIWFKPGVAIGFPVGSPTGTWYAAARPAKKAAAAVLKSIVTVDDRSGGISN